MYKTPEEFVQSAIRNAGLAALGHVGNPDGRYSAMKQYAAECDRRGAEFAGAARLLRAAMAVMLPLCSVDCRRMAA